MGTSILITLVISGLFIATIACAAGWYTARVALRAVMRIYLARGYMLISEDEIRESVRGVLGARRRRK